MAKKIKAKSTSKPVGEIKGALKEVKRTYKDKEYVSWKVSFETTTGTPVSFEIWKTSDKYFAEHPDRPYGYKITEWNPSANNNR